MAGDKGERETRRQGKKSGEKKARLTANEEEETQGQGTASWHGWGHDWVIWQGRGR